MSTLKYQIHLATLQSYLFDGFSKYDIPNLYEKLFFLFLFNGLGSLSASNIYDNIKEMLWISITKKHSS